MSNSSGNSIVYTNVLPVQDAHDFGYSHRRLKTSRQLREAALAEYPVAFLNNSSSIFYNRLLQYLLQPQLLDNKTGYIVLPAKTIAMLDGKCWNGNYKAFTRLEDFRNATDLELSVSDYSYVQGRSRTVLPQWPPRIGEAIKSEQDLAGTKHERVYFDDGKVYGRSRQIKEREQLKQLIQNANEAIPPAPGQEWLLACLNESQNQKTVNRLIKEQWPQALALAQSLPETTEHERATKKHTLFILNETLADCAPTYRTSPKTARIHAFGPNITQLPREIRKVLLGSGVTLDLVAAQAALIASVWGCPKLSRMLSANRPFWGIVLQRAKLPLEAKGAVKTALYSAAFGMTRENIRRNVAEDLVACGKSEHEAHLLAKRFISSTMISEILRARRQRMAEISKAGEVRDAFGRVLAISSSTRSERHAQLRSALAVEMQAYEQKIMLGMRPVIEHERVTVLCWLHDGIVIKARDKDEQPRIVQRLCRLVNAEATNLGVQTILKEE